MSIQLGIRPGPSILLRGLFLFSCAGLLAELLLLEHFEGWKQRVPLALLSSGVIAASWSLLAWTRGSRRALGFVSATLLLGGLAGLWFHYRGNRGFELEMVSTLGGLDLFRESMTGATPVLAPGALVGLGLLGWIAVYANGGERQSQGGRR
jgi:hypothetical protein